MLQSQLKPDYKPPGGPDRRPRQIARHHYALGGVLAFVLAVTLANVSSQPAQVSDLNAFEGGDVRSLSVPPASLPASIPQDAASGFKAVQLDVKSGDSLAALFSKHDLSAADLHAIMKLGSEVKRLRTLKPGDVINIDATEEGAVRRLSMDMDEMQRLEIFATDEGFHTRNETLPLQRRVSVATGTIDSSLYAAGYAAGLSDTVIMNLADIFGWDIDFALDMRKGDEFRIIYEEIYRNGEKIKDGPILAAEFINDGRELQAVRFEKPGGDAEYFAPDGRAMRKTFLRAPLNFQYVSSGFNPKRLHPISKRVKAHNGIDYKAPAGTPVYAAGDGRVTRSSYDKINGHHVFIQHGSTYVTKYLHFTRRTVKAGERVRQGQVIGYVGQTGLATGPHLHYEFLVNGTHRNPRTVSLPDAAPIDSQFLAQFTAISVPLLRQLELVNPPVRMAAAP